MNIIIKTKNLELTDSLRAYNNKRIDGLKKFIDVSEDSLEIQKETNHHRKGDIFKAEAAIAVPGKMLVAQAQGDDLGKAVTKVRDELKQEIKKYKVKKIELPRRAAKKSRDQVI